MLMSMHEPRSAMNTPWPADDDESAQHSSDRPSDAAATSPEQLRIARTNIAAARAVLPLAPEMAWAVPQLLKRIRLFSPGALSTNGVLRTLIRMPELDAQFLAAFTDSGFLSCDEVAEGARWKYDLDEMIARMRGGATAQVLEHCRALLTQQREKQSVDWEAAVGELRILNSWFPELRTLERLTQLYTRLAGMHEQSVHVAQCCMDRRAGLADSSAPARGRDAASQAAGLRILVVDDNRDAAVSLSTLLELIGHAADVAHNGLEAVRKASRERFDAILLDLGMPVMDGFEAAALLRQLRPAPALIACSAWDDDATRRRTTDLGFRAHLRKPVPFELLRAALGAVQPAASDPPASA
jgi:CheY-like chemotaxis protein